MAAADRFLLLHLLHLLNLLHLLLLLGVARPLWLLPSLERALTHSLWEDGPPASLAGVLYVRLSV